MSQPTETRTAGSFGELMGDGDAALKSGNLAEAEKLYRAALALTPEDPVAAHQLAFVLFHTSRQQEASEILIAAVGRGALPASVMLLGEIFQATGRDTDAARCYEIVLKREPANYDVLMKLGALRSNGGDKAAAADIYRRALAARPNDFAATEKYTDAIWDTDRDTCVALRERLLASSGDNLARRIEALRLLICNKEWAARINHGQMPYHASSLNELFFHYAADNLKDLAASSAAFLEAHPNNVSARVTLATARFCLGDRHGAEAEYGMVAKALEGKIHENMRFAPTFYDELRQFTPDDLVRDLPPLLNLTPPAVSAKGVLYLSCNFLYFHAFALPMVVSLRERSPQTPVHVHIMDADDTQASFAKAFLEKLSPLKFALSVERPGLENAPKMEARCYYHAVRFIRLFQHMETYKSPLWLMDVDAVINRDLTGLFAMLDDREVAMRVRPGRFEPWNQFNACVVGAGTSAASREYFRLLAAYVAYFHRQKRLRWGIDQLAMYGVFADMQDRGQAPSVALLGEREVDYDYQESGYVWCNSGAGKFQHLARLSKPQSPPTPALTKNKFLPVFERHWQEAERTMQGINATA